MGSTRTLRTSIALNVTTTTKRKFWKLERKEKLHRPTKGILRLPFQGDRDVS